MTNIFVNPPFVCSSINLFVYLKANTCSPGAVGVWWVPGRVSCDVRLQVLLCWPQHQKSRQIGFWFVVYEFRSPKFRGFVWCLSLIKEFIRNFACSAFLIILQQSQLLQKKVDPIIPPFLQQLLFSFCLSVWFFPDEFDGEMD